MHVGQHRTTRGSAFRSDHSIERCGFAACSRDNGGCCFRRTVVHHSRVSLLFLQVTVAQLTKDYDNLVGDALVSAGMIAYAGPFTPDFRQKLVRGWQDKLLELGIPHSEGCDVRLTLADPVEVSVEILREREKHPPNSSSIGQRLDKRRSSVPQVHDKNMTVLRETYQRGIIVAAHLPLIIFYDRFG